LLLAVGEPEGAAGGGLATVGTTADRRGAPVARRDRRPGTAARTAGPQRVRGNRERPPGTAAAHRVGRPHRPAGGPAGHPAAAGRHRERPHRAPPPHPARPGHYATVLSPPSGGPGPRRGAGPAPADSDGYIAALLAALSVKPKAE